MAAFRILVTSNTHLGFESHDNIRCNDTFVTMSEILNVACDEDVDFILHGGDLFHHNKPTRENLFEFMTMIRNGRGDGVTFQDVGDQPRYTRTQPVRKDRPILAIHGCHDGPTGEGALSVMDILDAGNVVHYFGKVSNEDDITIAPLVLSKNATTLAIYGLGNVPDERLRACVQKKKLKLQAPKEANCFNVLIIHQLRGDPAKQFLPDDDFHEIDPSLDLVIWCHASECAVEAIEIGNGTSISYLSRPGATVATSLCKADAGPKEVGLLEVHSNLAFDLRKVPLKTPRPLLFDTVSLSAASSSEVNKSEETSVSAFLQKQVRKLLSESDRSSPLMPLVRLLVQYDETCVTCVPQRFGLLFAGEVANAGEILVFQKKRQRRPQASVVDPSQLDVDTRTVDEGLLRSIVGQLKEMESLKLEVLSKSKLTEAVAEYADEHSTTVVESYLNSTFRATEEALERCDLQRVIPDDELDRMVARAVSSVEGSETTALRDPLSGTPRMSGAPLTAVRPTLAALAGVLSEDISKQIIQENDATVVGETTREGTAIAPAVRPPPALNAAQEADETFIRKDKAAKPVAKGAAGKLIAKAAKSGGRGKKRKRDEADGDGVAADASDAAQTEEPSAKRRTLESLKRDALVNLAKMHHQNASGKKADIIERLMSVAGLMV